MRSGVSVENDGKVICRNLLYNYMVKYNIDFNDTTIFKQNVANNVHDNNY